MNVVTVSPKFQVVIPKEIRRRHALSSGDHLVVLDWGGRIEFLPLHPPRKLRGLLKGRDVSFQREADREL